MRTHTVSLLGSPPLQPLHPVTHKCCTLYVLSASTSWSGTGISRLLYASTVTCKRIHSASDCGSTLAWQTFHSKKCFTYLARSGIMNASAMCAILYISLIDCLPRNVMNILVPFLTISTLLVRFGRNTPFTLSFMSGISTAQASIPSSFTAMLCARLYSWIICGILSIWLLRRYASFNALCEASQISVKNCGKLPYCEIWLL